MKVLIYSRVSTDEGNVEQQAMHLKKWAKVQGHEVVWTIKDTASAYKPLETRPLFKRILDKGWNFEYDAVLIYNLDRLTRNWYDENTIEKFFTDNWDSCKLISCTDGDINLNNASGRVMFRVKMAMNCYMPEDMRERSRIGIERAKKEGKYKGRKKGSKNKNNRKK